MQESFFEKTIIDQQHLIAYASDPDTYEILYMTQAAASLCGLNAREAYGKKCYELIQGRNAPCPFCTNDKLKLDVPYRWEHYNEKLQRWMDITDILVPFQGKNRRLEFARDITEQKETFDRVSNRLSVLENMGPAPEPNLTVLYSSALPENFKKYAAKVSINTSSVQYENDDVMKPVWGDDYSICCCVSATQTGKEMQFFGARANLAKCLLYAINGGVDEKSHEQCGPNYAPITGEYLNYDEVLPKYVQMLDWLAGLYVNVLNLIQYMHDKYYYEEAEMALIDTDVRRTFATGIAGFSHVIDSLSAIKYAKVKVVRDEMGLATGFEVEGDFPKYGNDDDRADEIGVWLLRTFLEMIKKRHTYRNSEATTSILTITSNVVYGKYTGALPDGRAAFTPFAPGANPSYGAEQNGLLASLNSVAKLPYHWALDGISNTQTINPDALGHSEGERVENLVQVMDGYFDQGAHHLNVNVFGKEKLIDAMEHPEKEEYANFTIRVSGYAVKFIDLTREQQMDVISRTCHAAL